VSSITPPASASASVPLTAPESVPGPVTSEGLGVAVDDVRAVEERAARAWPETDHLMRDGWRLRYSPGVPNRRANSVLPIHPLVTDGLETVIDHVESFYGERGLPSRFMVSPASLPENLDRVLEGRGYYINAPTDVQWAAAADVELAADVRHEVRLSSEPDMDWMGVYMEGVSDSDEIEKKSDLIQRIGGEFVLARVTAEGQTVSVGLGVVDTGWTGIFCMHTLNTHRRCGYARSVLGAMTRWGQEKGGSKMYLQVERSNPGARTFYERAGFLTRYGYHYRTKDV